MTATVVCSELYWYPRLFWAASCRAIAGVDDERPAIALQLALQNNRGTNTTSDRSAADHQAHRSPPLRQPDAAIRRRPVASASEAVRHPAQGASRTTHLSHQNDRRPETQASMQHRRRGRSFVFGGAIVTGIRLLFNFPQIRRSNSVASLADRLPAVPSGRRRQAVAPGAGGLRLQVRRKSGVLTLQTPFVAASSAAYRYVPTPTPSRGPGQHPDRREQSPGNRSCPSSNTGAASAARPPRSVSQIRSTRSPH